MKTNEKFDIILASIVFTVVCLYLVTPLFLGKAPGWFEPDTLSFELVKGLPAAFVALVIGAIAAYVAWRQAKVAAAKLKLDLFNQRYELYVCLWTFLTFIHSEDADLVKIMADLNNVIPKAAFLYGQATGSYFSTCLENGKRLRRAMRTLKRTAQGDPGRDQAVQEANEMAQWLDEAMANLQSRFAGHLNFEGWH